MSAFISSISRAVIKYYDVPSELLEDYLHYQKRSYLNHHPYDLINPSELLNLRLIPFSQYPIDPQPSTEFFRLQLCSLIYFLGFSSIHRLNQLFWYSFDDTNRSSSKIKSHFDAF